MILMWFITNYCNLDCFNCASRCTNDKELKYYTPLKEIISNIKILKEKKFIFNSIDLTGGEALLHPQIFTIIKLLKKNFPTTNIQIYTNGLSLDHFSLLQLKQLKKYNINLNISIYPRDKYIQKYEKTLKILNHLQINYSFQRSHFLFNSFKYANNKNFFFNEKSAINCLNNNIYNTLYLKNQILYPCCVALQDIPIQKSFYSDNCVLLKDKQKSQIVNTYLPICKKCQNSLPSQHPWHSTEEIKLYMQDIKTYTDFELYTNNYQAYYQLYFSQDQELQKIINHPLCHIALYNDVGLYEKHYIENKFINGYLDIFIYYNNIEDINSFIKLLKNQTILNKCNLYFIKDNYYESFEFDKILYNEFFPFISLNYNSYFLRANNYNEAKNLFLKHSFLNHKLEINPNNLEKLSNSKYFENEYFNLQ